MPQKLLIVDDDPDVRKTLSRLLELDYHVLEAATGQHALDIIKRESPPLMLLDVSLPDMSGIEVLRAIRTMGAVLNVIVLSGMEDINTVGRSFDLGALEYVTKPCDMPALRAKLDQLMRPKAPRAEDQNDRPWKICS